MDDAGDKVAFLPVEEQDPIWLKAIALLIWLLAGVVSFLPFALGTSPWNAVTLHVPGNQGNWWHVLVGAPFFLAYPMIWLRLRSVFSARPSTAMGRRLIWIVVALSVGGTTLVQVPFLLHLAGTSEWQRLSVLSLGFGIVIGSGLILLRRRSHLSHSEACVVGLETAYLANAALCLVVYSDAVGSLQSRLGWLVTMVIVWPMFFELIWLFGKSFRTESVQLNPRTT